MADVADDTILKTPRLVLRRFRESDFEDWFTHMNAPEVRHHLGGVDSREACRERFDRQAASWSGETGGWLVIERKEDAKRRGVASPDRAEALLLAYTAPPKPAQRAEEFDSFEFYTG